MTRFRRSSKRQPGLLNVLALRMLAAFALVLLPGMGHSVQAQTTSAGIFPDLRAVVLRDSEMPGYSADPARTLAQDRPDGSVTYDAVYTRASGGTGPTEVRLAAARTASGKSSAQALAATRDSLVGAGWSLRAVPLLGDEAVGFEASGAAAGGPSNAGYGYVFRFGRHLIGAVLSGPATSTNFDNALGYAVQMSARLDAMLALAPVPDPDPSPAGTVAMAQPAASAPVAASTTANAAPAAAASGTTANAASTTPPATGTTANAASTTPPSTGTAANMIPPSMKPSVSAAQVVSDVRLDNAPELQNGFRLGGFSGLVAPDPSGTSFISVTDRGPNGEIKVGSKKEIVFPLPKYSPRVVKMKLDGGRLNVTDTIPLRLPVGYTDPVTGTREISGLPAFDGTGEDAYSPDGKKAYGTDPNGVDTEGIALDSRDGSYWLGEEYGPSILHVNAEGTILMRITPKGLGLSMNGVSVRELLPEVYKLRKPNRGFEGIAISPDGTRLFVMLQSPLLNPDKKAGEASRNIRMAVFDTTDGDNPKLAGIYLYESEAANDVGAPTQDDIKIGDMAGVSRTSVLVAERDSADGGQHKKAYLVDITGATDISTKDTFSGKTAEEASEADLKKAGVAYVKKSMSVDLAKLGFNPDKFEGLAIVDSNTIAVVNDNDFGVSAIDSKGNVVKSGAMPRLVVIRVPQAIQ